MSENKARKLLREWKGDSYLFGLNKLENIGLLTKKIGNRTLLVGTTSDWAKKSMNTIIGSLEKEKIVFNKISGAKPNCPREDVYRIALQIANIKPESIVVFGGGSSIDCVKAATVLATYSQEEVMKNLKVPWDLAGTIDPYFGTGMITKMVEASGKKPIPVIAVQSASGSAAHLTKYSNITNPIEGQKKLIVDDAIVPKYSIFDYQVTTNSPRDLTLDGALDGIAHIWEVFMGATNSNVYEKIEKISVLGIGLIINHLKSALEGVLESRVALGLGTDLGGYAIMIGGTNGPHLGSFSLVDILTHGRACALLYPYYTVFFAPKIHDQLCSIADVYIKAGYIKQLETSSVEERELGEIVANAMIEFNQSLGFPTTLKGAGITLEHIKRMLEAAKDPQLRMKLQNMPVPLVPEEGDIDVFMRGVLEAAYTGELEKIILKKN